MTVLVKKVFISSKPSIVCLLCPPPCGPFSIQESAVGGLSYKVKKNPALQDSPPAAGRVSDILPFRRSAILAERFSFIGRIFLWKKKSHGRIIVTLPWLFLIHWVFPPHRNIHSLSLIKLQIPIPAPSAITNVCKVPTALWKNAIIKFLLIFHDFRLFIFVGFCCFWHKKRPVSK